MTLQLSSQWIIDLNKHESIKLPEENIEENLMLGMVMGF